MCQNYLKYFSFQIVLGALQFGQFCSLLSDSLISGFATGASVHVFSSQVKYLLGIKVPRFTGTFQLLKVSPCPFSRFPKKYKKTFFVIF